MSHPEFGKPPAQSDRGQKPAKKVASLFDLRLIIGALFTLYGIVLIIAGIADGQKELTKASGIRINLWAGIGMLVTGLLFLLWMKLTGDGHDRPERGKTAADSGGSGRAAVEGSPVT